MPHKKFTHRPINKLMVANRGEIAIRIFRAASEMNIQTVAIYTFEDRYSLHRHKADEAYQIGADEEPLKPYLDISEIIKIAKENGVDAIHPGYGFLSENDGFAQACMDADIIWIGPTPETMRGLGDKIMAKKAAIAAGVPIVPASEGAVNDLVELKRISKEIGYPVMVKAATGGGGRGMRIARSETDVELAFSEASGEAKTAFGNAEVFVEKYIEDPKHLEVQILGDNYGNMVHLFERDCSVQRRFQKVVEMAPSISLMQKTKDALYKYGVAICKHIGYQNAGTVEFLVDADENIFFIEVNTRIQVEHTITEVITGIDIVKRQILIASGLPLSDPKIGLGNQKDVTMRGVAIQCRITTEDPAENFKPDYGRLVAYRSASGFGIRLDAGSAFAGAVISPFFDSMLVKVTAWGMTLDDSANRLHRALREFRIRGVKSNISFLLKLLNDETFRSGNITVNYLGRNPKLMETPAWRDRSTKLLNYLGEVITNGHPDVKKIDPDVVFTKPVVPKFDHIEHFPEGTKALLDRLGPEKFAKTIRNRKEIMYTDTTFRDAHQSLLATRVRTYDMVAVAESFAKHHGADLFSMEVWGGATFDVSMRFLKEDPWRRLQKVREAVPNTLLQMLLRGSNGVGYKAYPDNLIETFIEESAKSGIDVFRIFDSLNWMEAMKTSIRAVRERTGALAEVSLCYTGDILKKGGNKFDLNYYLDLAKQAEDEGAHIIAIKDMAGLLKPRAAEYLIKNLRKTIDLPIHLHTHDTSSIQSATYLKAIEAGVDIVDVALASVSGLTSQPNFNSVVAMMEGDKRENPINLGSLNQFSSYWETVRQYYYPFETELKAGTAEVYDHEIPGGQYSNLRPQARGLGLEDQFETIKTNYEAVNKELLGGMVKVTPSSKVVGDMAMFLTANDLTVEDVKERGETLAFPDSMISLMKGELGQRAEGWPAEFQKMVLKNEEAFTNRPNAHLEPIDFDKDFEKFKLEFPGKNRITDFLSYQLYPKVYTDFYKHELSFGNTSRLPTTAYFYGLKPNEEIAFSISKGKTVMVSYMNSNEPREETGTRLVVFRLNGAIRSVVVNDKSLSEGIVSNQKAIKEEEIGSPLQGSLASISVKEGDIVAVNDPLFVIEAMKMESTITAPFAGRVKRIYLKGKTMVSQDDLVLELEKV